jgi:methionyl-tRNA formyltransferase
LNITVLANRDLASNLALNHLLPALAAGHRVSVYLSDAVGGKADRPQALQDLKFFEQTLFNELLFPLVDGGDNPGELRTYAGLARHTAQPIASLNRVNSEAGLATLRGDEPDLIVSIRYGGILRDEAIAIPALGVINLHSGLLPQYRGVMASFRALLAGEDRLGTTLHYIQDPGIDTGDVIAQTALAVEPGRSYLWHVLALYPPAIEKLLACVAELARGDALPTHPQGAGGQYFSFPDAEDLAAFQAHGLALFDVDEIHAIAQRYTGPTP